MHFPDPNLLCDFGKAPTFSESLLPSSLQTQFLRILQLSVEWHPFCSPRVAFTSSSSLLYPVSAAQIQWLKRHPYSWIDLPYDPAIPLLGHLSKHSAESITLQSTASQYGLSTPHGKQPIRGTEQARLPVEGRQQADPGPLCPPPRAQARGPRKSK